LKAALAKNLKKAENTLQQQAFSEPKSKTLQVLQQACKELYFWLPSYT